MFFYAQLRPMRFRLSVRSTVFDHQRHLTKTRCLWMAYPWELGNLSQTHRCQLPRRPGMRILSTLSGTSLSSVVGRKSSMLLRKVGGSWALRLPARHLAFSIPSQPSDTS